MKPDLDKVEAQAKEDQAERQVIMRRFRCADPNCNTLLTKEAIKQGHCGGCQGVRIIIARYITDEEQALIEAGQLHPHEVDLDAPGVEPPAPQEVR